MSKYSILFLLLASIGFSQEQPQIDFYGEIGYGLSNTKFPSSNSGINSNLSLSVGSDTWFLKLSQKVNGVFSFTYPKDKVRSKDILIGKSINLYREYNLYNEPSLEWNMFFYAGVSAVQNQANITYINNGTSTTHVEIENGYGIPIEIEIQYVFPKYYGGALTLFYNFNRFRNFYGLSLSGVLGYF